MNGTYGTAPADASGAAERSRFGALLAEWGPDAPRKPVSLAEAQRHARQLATSHYENFSVVSWLLPRRLHQDFYNIYAYCRWSDDLGDEVEGDDRSLQLLAWWERELHACYAGETWHPVFVALRDTILRKQIPIQPFLDLLSAFAQDQRVKSYDCFDQLHDYCRRSANPVGRLVLYVCGAYTEQHAAWSDSICTGLQLANFWQDVRRDADIGRVYLPRDDCERFGYTDDDLHARRTTDAFRNLMHFEVARAREFLVAGLPLVPQLKGRLQVDIDLFARGGLKILERIEAIDYGVWEQRPEVTKRDAAMLLGPCIARWLLRGCGLFAPP